MAARTLEITFIGNPKHLQDSMKQVEDSVGSLEKKTDGLGSKFEAVGKAAVIGMAAAGAGVVGGLAVSINAAANFEHAVDQVGAVSNATADEMQGLSDAALRIGKDTAFSATEAAGAMEQLAANGLSAKDIMEGAADATVALAAAGGTDLKMAADVASTAMAVWGIKASEMGEVVNRLAGAANVSRFGVEDMSLAVAQGGGAAKLAGVEFGDFTTMIAATASSFNSGADAGTSFKTFLNGLTPSTKSAAAAFDELGLFAKDGSNRFFDAKGNLKSMAEVTQILHDATKDLTEEQKSQYLTTIFGTDAMRMAGAVSALTGDQIAGMSEKMRTTDAAAVAAQRMGNFKGSMEALKGSIETIEIEIGLRFLPVLTKLANFAAEELPKAFDWFEREAAPRISEAATVIGEKVRQIGDWFQNDVQPKILAFVEWVKPKLEEFGAKVQEKFKDFQAYYESDLKPALENIRSGFERVVQWVVEHWDQISAIVKPVIDEVKNNVETAFNAVRDIFKIVIDLINGDWSKAWHDLKALVSDVVDGMKNSVGNAFDLIKGAISGTMDAIKSLVESAWGGIVDAIESGAGWIGHWLDVAGGYFNDFANMALSPIQWVIDKVGKLIDKIKSIPSIGDFLPSIPSIPGFASGTTSAPGGLAMVGEQGPELVNLPRGARVWNASETRQMLAGGGPQVTINVTGPVYAAEDGGRAFFGDMGYAMVNRLRAQGAA